MRVGARSIRRAALAALAHTRADLLFQPFFGGIGAILTLHRVMDASTPYLNRDLGVSSTFLEALIVFARQTGYDIVTLDEARRRVIDGNEGRRFVCFTFDDGYADNYLRALPAFRKHAAPMTVYVTAGMIDRSADYWWGTLEKLIMRESAIVVEGAHGKVRHPTATPRQKMAVFDLLCAQVHSDMQRYRPMLTALFARYDVDVRQAQDEDALTSAQLLSLAADPLVEIGAHSVSHRSLAHLSLAQADQEVRRSRALLEQRIGKDIRHFSYPYGSFGTCGKREFALARDCGYATATTTRHGTLSTAHRNRLHALPRIPIIGQFQSEAVVRMQLSGMFAPLNRWLPDAPADAAPEVPGMSNPPHDTAPDEITA
jgi:peptidoglycan/xylan/chitin deacetylase (PgdA/CDA1 family)